MLRLLLILVVCSGVVIAQSPIKDASCIGTNTTIRDNLMTLYISTNGPNWVIPAYWKAYGYPAWNTTSDYCRWAGIGCGFIGYNDPCDIILVLEVNGFGLDGTIAPEIGNLNTLLKLDLSYNPNLRGSIPRSLHHLTQLQTLYLSSTGISGSIPDIFGQSTLVSLYVSQTQLYGPLPSFPSNCQLWQLDVSSTQINSIESIANCVNLTILQINQTPINSIKGNFPLLEEIAAHNAQLGRFPLENLCQYTELLKLDLTANGYIGEIPACINSLPNLQILYLGNNQFSKINKGRFQKLQYLNLGNNNLTDSLENFKFPAMIEGTFSNNQFKGRLPYFNDVVISLALDGNDFTGPIPKPYLNVMSILDLRSNPRLVQTSSDQTWLSINKNIYTRDGNQLCPALISTNPYQSLTVYVSSTYYGSSICPNILN